MPRHAVDPHQFDRAFDFLAATVRREPEVPRAVLAVANADAVIRCEGFAATDGRADAANTLTAFPIASITKPIFATALMQLVASGRLMLTAPLCEYIADFGSPAGRTGEPGGEAISTWHVLTHTSGLTDADIGMVVERRPSRDAFRRSVHERRLAFAPGAAYTYSSDSFYMLAELLEQLAGRPYPEVLAQELLGPLGMTHTSFDPGTLDCPNAGLLWVEPAGDDIDALQEAFISLAMPGAGLWSTAADLVAFGQAMLARGEHGGIRVLPSAFVDLMLREQTTGVLEPGVPPTQPHYGLGWDRPTLDGSMPGSASAFGHSGATGTRLWVDPEADLVVVFLMNRWGASDRWWRGAVNAVYAALD